MGMIFIQGFLYPSSESELNTDNHNLYIDDSTNEFVGINETTGAEVFRIPSGSGSSVKTYEALISQNAPSTTDMVIGQIWTIDNYVAGDNFSNMELISGTMNTTGCKFRVIAPHPLVWNSSNCSYDGAPYLISIKPDGSIGALQDDFEDVEFIYGDVGDFYINSPSFISKKTVAYCSNTNSDTGLTIDPFENGSINLFQVGIVSRSYEDIMYKIAITIKVYS
jgi:hypothetical protein